MPERDFAVMQAALHVAEKPKYHHRNVVVEILTAVAANDFDSLTQHFSDDAELHIHGFPNIDGVWRGQKQVIAGIAENFGKLIQQKPMVESIIHQDGALAIRLEETGVYKASGRRYHLRGVIWFTFDGSRVSRIEEFLQTVIPG